MPRGRHTAPVIEPRERSERAPSGTHAPGDDLEAHVVDDRLSHGLTHRGHVAGVADHGHPPEVSTEDDGGEVAFEQSWIGEPQGIGSQPDMDRLEPSRLQPRPRLLDASELPRVTVVARYSWAVV